MVIGRDYVKNEDIGREVVMNLAKLIPKHIGRMSNILMIKKNGIVYELKNRCYTNDNEIKNLPNETYLVDFNVISRKDFNVISRKDFVDIIKRDMLSNSKNDQKFINKLMEPLKNKFILFDCDTI